MSEELPAVCRRMFGLGAAREQNYIFGLSMGGYGAMKCALTYPDRYAGAASFSGVCDLRRTVERRSISLHESEIAAIFGEEKAVPPKDDLFVLAERLSGEAPGLYLSCGEQDGLAWQMSAFPRISRRSALRTGLTIGRARTPGTSGINRSARRSRTF